NTGPYLQYHSAINVANGICGSSVPGCVPVPNEDQETVHGATVICTGSQVVLNDSGAGYSCLTPQQYGAAFQGPAGGGVGRWHAGWNQDYHARFIQGLGAGNIILDGYQDNYGYLNVKSPTGAFHDDIVNTKGYLIADEFPGTRHDFSFGVNFLHQYHLTTTVIPVQFQRFDTTNNSYFLRDAWTATKQLQVFGDFWLEHSVNTASNNFDPRVSVVYRPDSADVIRVTGGKSNSIPDPTLLYGGFTFDPPGSAASLNPICGAGNLNSIGSGQSPNLQPETANDLELALGHRFPNQAVVQANLYDSYETNPILSGTFPLSVVPPNQIPPQANLDPFLAKIATQCGPVTNSALGVSTSFNAGSAKYQGVGINFNVPVVRYVSVNGDYNIQSAVYNGISNNILSTNTGLVNGSQIGGVPFKTASLGFDYHDPRTQFEVAMIGNYVGTPNNFNRIPYTFANLTVTKTVDDVTFNLGVNNIFNNSSQPFGYIGFGTFNAQNAFGSAQNAFDQGSEQYGLPPRQAWLTIMVKI
ncbi:MAG: TonB-dependent receptor, partial [Candidatus Eremiobacteraeota bacterium]|nr:TonB-dependent receptor [Candidatus Eremiobacteraeota bacterium]